MCRAGGKGRESTERERERLSVRVSQKTNTGRSPVHGFAGKKKTLIQSIKERKEGRFPDGKEKEMGGKLLTGEKKKNS